MFTLTLDFWESSPIRKYKTNLYPEFVIVTKYAGRKLKK